MGRTVSVQMENYDGLPPDHRALAVLEALRVVAAKHGLGKWAEGCGIALEAVAALVQDRDRLAGENLTLFHAHDLVSQRAIAAESERDALLHELADLHDSIRTAYMQCPGLPICAENPEAFDDATSALHSLCLIVGIYGIQVSDDTAATLRRGEG